jgi:hypothetical protein
MQVKYCTQRAYQRLWNDKTSTVTTIIGQIASMSNVPPHLAHFLF